jgi:hypothetical protein
MSSFKRIRHHGCVPRMRGDMWVTPSEGIMYDQEDWNRDNLIKDLEAFSMN